mmetsp:Transcript_38013/g.88856  ORF Transcript_38013/g.88856 Transcript_38013/m.88856 type:complete len:2604 (-) Transcript_38013:319-8130(-)
MVFEGRIADMLQNQASRFLRGFTAEQIRIGLLKGRLELQGLALNPEPLDVLFMESEIPLVMKAGLLSSAVAQVSLLQGELELTIDGILLVLCPACRWLAKDEVFSHRLNEIQRLEFVHMRSQCQRRTLEHEMFRQLFQDYLSRLKITVKNVHIRIEVEGELFGANGSAGASGAVGMVLNSCTITPMKGAVQAAAEEREKAAANPQSAQAGAAGGELLLAERVGVKGLSLYHEMPDTARIHVSWATYQATKDEPLGVFQQLKQDQFTRLMAASRRHCTAPAGEQLMPPTSFAISLDLKSTLVRDGFHVDNCLVMEIAVKLEGTPSRLHFSDGAVEHLQWFVSRTLDFQLWQFLHPTTQQARFSARGRGRAQARWTVLRRFLALRRRIHSNAYSLEEAITMRVHCKEYVRLYKKKFNGPASVVGWRRGLPALTSDDAARLAHIEILYPADKLVNFRLMAHAELKTEMALNNFLNADEISSQELAEDESGQYRRVARELTPLEQLHLHGQHGYGVNIYRGLPPPPSSLKIRIEIQAPEGLWWVCQFGKSSKPATPTVDTSGWAVAVDCVAQPLRVLLVDSVVDTSVFTTIEVPPAAPSDRPLSLLLGRSLAAFESGSPGRGGRYPVSCGGSGEKEWLSLLEMDGHVCLCGQLKTLLTSSPNSPWDIFLHLSCGDPVDVSVHHASRGRIPTVGIPPGIAGGQGPSTTTSSNGRLRACFPYRMPSGQAGPLAAMLRSSLASASKPVPGCTVSAENRSQVNSGPSHSAIAWLARLVCGTRDIAMFRVSVRLPPLSVQVPAGRNELTNYMQLPRFDAACHLEHGGLVDGFVVGLHSLRHFAASIVAPSNQLERFTGSQSVIRSGNSSIAWPLRPLEQAPPVSVIFSALGLALSAVLAAGTENSDSKMSLDATLVSLLRSSQLVDLLPAEEGGAADGDSPAAAVTLVLVLIAVTIGRRLIWELRDSKQGSSRDPNIETAEGRAAAAALTEVHRLAGAMMRVLLLMGFPLHSRCLPVAAWAGAVEVLIAASASVESIGKSKSAGFAQLRHSLSLWAARGAFANLHSRQDEVIRWLLRQGAKLNEVDQAGRTLLDWACWGGCEGLAAMCLRAGLLSLRSGRNAMTDVPPADQMKGPSDSTSPPSPSLPLPPSPLTLAMASRSPGVIAMLLRAGGDPHTPPHGSSCGALLLAVRNCEFELALQVLHGSPFVSVESALGAPLAAVGGSPSASTYMKGDMGDGAQSLGCKVRATVTIIDSLRRFAASLPRRSAEDAAPICAGSSPRSHPPGPHPDEGIFAAAHIPYVDILHPVMEQFPQPVHKVSFTMQVRAPPLAWLKRKPDDPWQTVHHFIECCLLRGFSPDAAVVSRALPALSSDACQAVQHMMFTSTGSIFPRGLAANGTPTDSGSSAQWFGAVLGASHDTEDIRGPGRGIVQHDAAVVSFAKEIRDLRSQPGARNGSVPPLDIVSALGVNGEDVGRANLRRADSNRTAMVQASTGPAVVWVAMSFGNGTIAAGPLPVDFVHVDSGHMTWKIRSSGTNLGKSRPMQQSVKLDELAACRQLEQRASQGGSLTSLHVIELRLAPEADASTMLAELKGAEGDTRMNGHHTNGQGSLRNGESTVLSIMFANSQDAEHILDALPGQQGRTRSGRGDYGEVASDPLLTALMQEPPPGKFEAAKAAATYLQSGQWQVPSSSSTKRAKEPSGATDLPHSVRVVVLGAPRAGKSRVASSLQADLGGAVAQGGASESDSTWLRVSSGQWPAKGQASAEVHIWDTSATPQPGMLPWLIDPRVLSIIVVVMDAGTQGNAAPAEELLLACVDQAVLAQGCIRVLVVDNIFPGFAASLTGAVRPELQQKATPSGTAICSAIRCNLASSEGLATLRKGFSTTMTDLLRDAEVQVSSPPSSPHGRQPRAVGSVKAFKNPSNPWGVVMEPCSSTLMLGAGAEGSKERKLLGSRLRADSSLLEPSAVSWAWAAICAAQGYLLEGSSTTYGALVAWERLEHVLSSAEGDKRVAGEDRSGSGVVHLLLSALTNLGLVCPIPCVNRADKGASSPSLCCTWVLIPDFARRLRLTPSMAAGIQGRSPSKSSGKAASSSSTSPPIAARLVWDQGAAPSLRSALRDFLARGVLGGGSARVPSRSLEAHRFALLEAGPTGRSSGSSSAGLEPGFVLTFDFAQVTTPDSAHEDTSVSPRGLGPCTPKPPASVTAMSPSGLVQDPTRQIAQSNTARGLDDELGLTGSNGSRQRLTVLAVGTSTGQDKAFWDVHCTGPHAQWALRALLGEGSAGHGAASSCFVALSRSAGTKVSAPPSAGSAEQPAWPLPVPQCIVSASASTASRGSLVERPTGQEFFGLGWLFNGPQAGAVREALLPGQDVRSDSGGGGGFAACCAALCGKRTEQYNTPLTLEDDGGIAGLASCADFEASMLARSWKMAPRFLDEALASSAEAWAICSASLVRVAHDSAAAVGGDRGRALPLLHADASGGSGSKVVALVHEGPVPLMVPAGPARGPGVIGSVRSCAGVEAWLRLCKPAALWSAAGIAHGYSAAVNELQATHGGSVGNQVVDALRQALSVRLTEQMVAEVWDALLEAGAAQSLVRRAGGTWTQVNGSMLLL